MVLIPYAQKPTINAHAGTVNPISSGSDLSFGLSLLSIHVYTMSTGPGATTLIAQARLSLRCLTIRLVPISRDLAQTYS